MVCVDFLRLTEALRFFTTPVAGALTGEDGGQRELIALITAVANAGTPLEVCPHHLPIRDTGWSTAHNSCKRTQSITCKLKNLAANFTEI